MSKKYSKKRLGGAKKSTTNAIKTASKRAIEKTTEASGNLIGNKIADKMKNVSTSPKKFYSQNSSKELHSKTNEKETEIPKEVFISPEKRQQIIGELRNNNNNNNGISKNNRLARQYTK